MFHLTPLSWLFLPIIVLALQSSKGTNNDQEIYDRFLQVEALAVQLTQREGELMQEKAEVKKLANFLKQVIWYNLNVKGLFINVSSVGFLFLQNQNGAKHVRQVKGENIGKHDLWPHWFLLHIKTPIHINNVGWWRLSTVNFATCLTKIGLDTFLICSFNHLSIFQFESLNPFLGFRRC